MKTVLFGALAMAGLLMVSDSLFAHHSASTIYDQKREVTLTGTVIEFEFINPHSKIHFEVKDDQGNLEEWVGEMAPPNNLRRQGWTRNTIKPGDQITVVVNVARNGSKRADLLRVSINGKEISREQREGRPGYQ